LILDLKFSFCWLVLHLWSSFLWLYSKTILDRVIPSTFIFFNIAFNYSKGLSMYIWENAFPMFTKNVTGSSHVAHICNPSSLEAETLPQKVNLPEFLIKIALNLYINLRKINMLTTLSLPLCKKGMYLCMFMSSLIFFFWSCKSGIITKFFNTG
jgi:hypothetical protein